MKSPEKCTIEELKPYASEYSRRLAMRPESGRQKVLRPCPKCGRPFGARELRYKCPEHKPPTEVKK